MTSIYKFSIPAWRSDPPNKLYQLKIFVNVTLELCVDYSVRIECINSFATKPFIIVIFLGDFQDTGIVYFSFNVT